MFVRPRFTAGKAEPDPEKRVTHRALLQELRANRSLDRVHGETPPGHSTSGESTMREEVEVAVNAAYLGQETQRLLSHFVVSSSLGQVGVRVSDDKQVVARCCRWRTGTHSLGHMSGHYEWEEILQPCLDGGVKGSSWGVSQPPPVDLQELTRGQDVCNGGNVILARAMRRRKRRGVAGGGGEGDVEDCRGASPNRDALKELRGSRPRVFQVVVAGHNCRSNAALLVELDEETASDVLFGGTATRNAPCWR
ncbi:hypothetical protein BDW22DRAFT_1344049 [Trametopsis cervina]|nr:hypothetical protein BDW22DRAFT_1344049 [Trametopsis cervina]